MKKTSLLLAFLLIGIIANAQVPNYVDTTALKAWFSFTGNAIDSSGHSNNGTVMGATLTTDAHGSYNSAYSFTGGAGIVTPFIPSSTSTSISVKFNATSLSSITGGTGTLGLGNCLVTSDSPGIGGFSVGVNYGYLRFLCVTTWFSVPYTFTTGTWYSIAISFSSTGNIKAYVNGIKVVDTATTAFPIIHPNNFKIGKGSPTAYYVPFDGKIDNVGIWQRTLGACEVSRLHAESISLVTSQPVADTAGVGGTATYTINDIGGTATYQWQENTGSGFSNLSNTSPYSGVTTKTLTINPVSSAMNNYQYRCLRMGTCSDTSNTALLTLGPVGIQKMNTASQFIISPNPVHNEVIMTASTPITKVQIVNVIGQKVFDAPFNANKVTIDLNYLAPGIYFMQANNGVPQKFVKE